MKTGNTLKRARGFLSRLRRDQSGNTLAMVAAGVIPVIGIIGGAVDMSRGYMAKARLQQACDAGALAARSAMVGMTLTNAEKAVGYQYFDFNYPAGSYETTNLVRTYTQPTSNLGVPQPFVKGTATVDVPTTLMRVFGNEEIDLTVNCMSKKDVSNADVVMVLDVTGSMNSSMVKATSGGSETRISALRRSVQAFYNSLGGGIASGDTSKGRIRYGFVPYGTVVNPGYLLSNNQMVDSHYYSSRLPSTSTLYSWVEGSQAKGTYGAYSPATIPAAVVTASQQQANYTTYNTSTTGTGNGSYSYTRISGSTNTLARTVTSVNDGGTMKPATSANCYKANSYASGSDNNSPGIADVRLLNASTTEAYTSVTPPIPVYPDATRTYRNYTSTRKNDTRGLRYRWFNVGSTGGCRLEMATAANTATTWVATATTTQSSPLTWTTHAVGSFVYGQRLIDVSGLKNGGSTWKTTINVPNLNVTGGSWTNVKLSGTDYNTAINAGGTGSSATVEWRGCVEERTTDPTINASTALSPMPANANDLETKRLSTNYDTRWRPWLPTAFFGPTGTAYASVDAGCPTPALKLQEYANYTTAQISDTSHNFPTLFDPASGGPTSFFYPYSSTASQNVPTLQNYINRIKLVDGTVHDSGFIWGMHLLSGQAMFGAENPDYHNGNLVSRNLVFMTDGDLNPAEDRYAYTGYNQVDGRVAPKTYDQNAMMPVHNRRLRILCQAAKEQGITVWVVVIKDGVSQDADLKACATSGAHFKTADTADELVASFTQIAQSIGGLRLTQ